MCLGNVNTSRKPTQKRFLRLKRKWRSRFPTSPHQSVNEPWTHSWTGGLPSPQVLVFVLGVSRFTRTEQDTAEMAQAFAMVMNGHSYNSLDQPWTVNFLRLLRADYEPLSRRKIDDRIKKIEEGANPPPSGETGVLFCLRHPAPSSNRNRGIPTGIGGDGRLGRLCLIPHIGFHRASTNEARISLGFSKDRYTRDGCVCAVRVVVTFPRMHREVLAKQGGQGCQPTGRNGPHGCLCYR